MINIKNFNYFKEMKINNNQSDKENKISSINFNSENNKETNRISCQDSIIDLKNTELSNDFHLSVDKVNLEICSINSTVIEHSISYIKRIKEYMENLEEVRGKYGELDEDLLIIQKKHYISLNKKNYSERTFINVEDQWKWMLEKPNIHSNNFNLIIN